MTPDVHLDLGCGKRPRNPYRRTSLCGTDIRALGQDASFEFKPCNLALDRIPWSDDSFASVSAFDVIEHIPRVLASADGRATYFPFVQLMNEVWRVLAPRGLFFALTPAYPSPLAFQDPTHVNVITDRTHEYFCGDKPLGRMYGFEGHFRPLRTMWVEDAAPYRADPHPAPLPVLRQLAYRMRDAGRVIRGKRARIREAHYFLWEFEKLTP
jgi:SAM-dependent methyltransferase